jgi:hypothetical protein
MKHLILLLAISTLPFYAQGQLQLISFSGDHHRNGEMSISFSLGEVAVETFTGGNTILTQGFHQPDIFSTSTSNFNIYDFKVFPNPVQNELLITSNQWIDFLGLRFQIMDIQGRVLLSEQQLVDAGQTSRLNVGALPPGIHILHVFNMEGQIIAASKIVKI